MVAYGCLLKMLHSDGSWTRPRYFMTLAEAKLACRRGPIEWRDNGRHCDGYLILPAKRRQAAPEPLHYYTISVLDD